jgi:hypothetical protein
MLKKRPKLVDGDIFKTAVPLDLSFNKVKDTLNDNQILNNNKDRNCVFAYIVQNETFIATQVA